MTDLICPTGNSKLHPHLSHSLDDSLDNSDGLGDRSPFNGVTNATDLVAAFLNHHQILVTADGSPHRATIPDEDLAAKLRRKPIDHKILEDEIVEFCRLEGYPFKRADLLRGIRLVLDDRRSARRQELLLPLYEPLADSAEMERAAHNFEQFAKIIEADPRISIAGLKQFIFSVKKKQIGGKIGNPLMLIFMNHVQGSGKSEFVLRLLKCLGELASDPVPFSELTDERSIALFQNAVVNFDDAGAISRQKLAALKVAISAHTLQRRVLGTSTQRRIEHGATFVATTNENILRIVPDSTGHRRFLVLPFKNGAVEKGGDAEVWAIVNKLDFHLMWRSVSEKNEEPIKAVLRELHEYQQAYAPPNPFESWVRVFNPASDAVLNITGPKGIPARKLWEHFSEETSSDMEEKAFALEMKAHIENPAGPFLRRRRVSAGYVYVLNPKFVR